MSNFLMKSTAVNTAYECKSGNNYTSDASGFVSAVLPGDVLDLLSQGLILIPSKSADGLNTLEVELTRFRNVTGAALAAAATGGALGYAVTLGTSYALVAEATSSSAKTDVAMAEVVLPSTYVPGTDITCTINANYTGGGTATGASCSQDLSAYAISDAGVSGADLCATNPILITGTAADCAFTITGATLKAGQRLLLKVTNLVTTSAGALTGQINSVRLS